ncbi:YrhK family protein [Marinomonas pollencensis]|uniref:YrhK-like protein n=1 Tax=Marinomonas pollencensis TaxID=491954 RepID=A0A3E0DQ58_9GAMM|nr:YrhK family protein [Marinomonas pollencensis]REG85009.1 YrhK-like protein [Marinomonas pollencensis]
MISKNKKQPLEVDLDQSHVVIQRRYEALGAVNDLLIAVWFLIGSFFFLKETLVLDGTWLFILGSAQLLIKPIIKLTSLVHVKRVYKSSCKQQ